MFKGVKMKNFSGAENFGTLTTDCSLQVAAQHRGPPEDRPYNIPRPK